MERVWEVDGEVDGRGEVCSGVDLVGCSVAIEVEIVVPVESIKAIGGVVVIELVDVERSAECDGAVGIGCVGRNGDGTHLDGRVACVGLTVGRDLCDGELSVERDAGQAGDGQGGVVDDECCAVECSEVDVPS